MVETLKLHLESILKLESEGTALIEDYSAIPAESGKTLEYFKFLVKGHEPNLPQVHFEIKTFFERNGFMRMNVAHDLAVYRKDKNFLIPDVTYFHPTGELILSVTNYCPGRRD